jgi:hypothetical protein
MMFDKLEKKQIDDLMMTYVTGLHTSIAKVDYPQMFLWASLAFVISELNENEKNNE